MEIKEIKAKPFVIDTLLKTKGYKEFTEIQKRVIPLALDNKNVIGKSATGNGKTDAFLSTGSPSETTNISSLCFPLFFLLTFVCGIAIK